MKLKLNLTHHEITQTICVNCNGRTNTTHEPKLSQFTGNSKEAIDFLNDLNNYISKTLNTDTY